LTFYPGYTAATVLDEYASRFFVLLQRGVEIDNEHRQWQLTATSYPYLKEASRKQIALSLDNTAHAKPDTIKINEDRKKLRKLFNKGKK